MLSGAGPIPNPDGSPGLIATSIPISETPTSASKAPLVAETPTRARLGSRRSAFPQKGVYIGRGSRAHDLGASVWANPFRIGADGCRDEVIIKFDAFVRSQEHLLAQVPSLGNKVLVCHCAVHEPCHADVLISLFKELSAADGDVTSDEDELGNPKALRGAGC